jgi:hypothetical protein
MRRQQSDGGRQLNFEFSDDDEDADGSVQGKRGNATAQTPEKATPGEKRGRGQEWLRQRTAKKDRRPSRKRLQEQWREDMAAGQKQQRRGTGSKERRRVLRGGLQSAVGAASEGQAAVSSGGLPTVSAGGQLRCQRACCRIGRQRCRDLSEQIGELHRQLSQLTDGIGYGAWMRSREQQLVDAHRELDARRGAIDEERMVVRQELAEAKEQIRMEERAALAKEKALLEEQRKGLEEQRSGLEEQKYNDMVEVANVWRRVEEERMAVEFGRDSFEIGEDGLNVLIAEAAEQDVMRRKDLMGDWHHFNVKDAPMKYFATGQVDGRLVQLRRESRGLVVDGAGAVQVRPVQKFYSMSHLTSEEEDSLGAAAMVAVTEKMDGEMICGAVRDGQVELWSRGGWTDQARSATRWAFENKRGVLTLVTAVWERGGTATFEYVGRQSRVKVRYAETDLVLVAVRDRRTGVWWQHDQLVRVGQQHGVTVVRRWKELEGLRLHILDDKVCGWEDSEGVVVQMSNGVVLKVKSWWWRQRGKKEKRRWYRPDSKLQAGRREKQRRLHLEKEDLRVVLRGWNHWVHPSRSLQEFSKAMKVEALYRRSDGRQGVVVVSFRTAEAAKAALGCRRLLGSRLHAVRAYSSRTTPNEEYRVKTWWKQGGQQGCGR